MTAAPPARLLLVDDRPANLVALRAILQRPDYELLSATSGQEALSIALREPLSVILLDVVMPEMDGFEVATHLKALARTREIPILFLTAVATDVHQMYRAYDVGAIDYLIKPLDPELVQRKVATYVQLVRQREQIEEQARQLRAQQERQHAAELAELRTAGERWYRKLLDGVVGAIGWTMNDELRIVFISDQATRILGFPIERFLEPGFWEARLHPDERTLVLPHMRRALAEAREVSIDHRLFTEAGTLAWFHTGMVGEPAVPGSGALLHGFSLDVTELVEARLAATRATEARETLLGVVAHDLRSPLSSIRLSAELLEDRAGAADAAPQIHNAARTIVRSADRMERLIQDLLDFAQIQAGRIRLELREWPARQLVHDTVELFRPIAAEKQQHFDGRAPEDLVAWCDRDRVLQILANLVGNALKFTPEGGSVDIRAASGDGEAVFTVEDTGPGLAAEDASHIWDRYWRTATRSGGGVGLGLSIARGLVEAHGGRIWLETTLGAGAAFHFTLPRAGTRRPG